MASLPVLREENAVLLGENAERLKKLEEKRKKEEGRLKKKVSYSRDHFLLYREDHAHPSIDRWISVIRSNPPRFRYRLHIRQDAYQLLCNEINGGDPGRNWVTLAEKTNCSDEEIQRFKLYKNPTSAVLSTWTSGPGSREQLLSILADMGRKDLTELADCTTREEYLSAAENIEYNHAYNRALSKGQTKDRRMQVMIIGHDRSGKTSLMRNLLGLNFDADQPSTSGIETEVVEITEQNSRNPWSKKDRKLLTTSDELHEHVFDAMQVKDNPMHTVPTVGEFVHPDSGDRDFDGVSKVTRSDNVTVISHEAEEKNENNAKENENIENTGATNEFKVLDESERNRAKVKLGNNDGEGPIQVILQDFAGQELFHESHCCFLKSNCPVVLVYDARCNLEDIARSMFKCKDGTEQNFDNPYSLTNKHSVSRWFKMLDQLRESESDNEAEKKFFRFRDKKTGELYEFILPPVLVALTHSNDVDKGQIRKIERKIREIGDHFQNVFTRFYAIDNSTPGGHGVKDLREDLCLLCKELLKEQKPVPLLWLKFEEKLQRYAENKSVRYQVVEDVAKEVGLENVKHPITFLHSRGVILYYSEDLPVVMNPWWVMDCFKAVITVPQAEECRNPSLRPSWYRLRNKAILDDNYLDKFLGDGEEFLKIVMERFGLICPWPYGDSKAYLVPSLAPLLPKGNEISRLSESPIAPVFLRIIKKLPSQEERGIHVPGVFGKLQVELIKKLSEDSNNSNDLTSSNVPASTKDSMSCKIMLLHEQVRLRGNFTLLPVMYNGTVFELFLTEIVENVKIGVFCSTNVEKETQRNFLNYLQSTLKHCLLGIRDNRIPLYRRLKWQLAIECPECNVVDEHCREHNQKNCERDSCLKLIELKNPSESSIYISCNERGHHYLRLKGVDVWFTCDHSSTQKQTEARTESTPNERIEMHTEQDNERASPGNTVPRSSQNPEPQKALFIGELNDEIFGEICQKLNKQMSESDFKLFGKKMGYSIKEVNNFRQKKNPPKALLTDWQSKDGNDLNKFISVLEEMGQQDIVAILQNAIVDKIDDVDTSSTPVLPPATVADSNPTLSNEDTTIEGSDEEEKGESEESSDTSDEDGSDEEEKLESEESSDTSDEDGSDEEEKRESEESSDTSDEDEGLKIDQLDPRVYFELCCQLNKSVPRRDFIALAGAMGYNLGHVENFKQNPDHSHALLCDWKIKPGNDVLGLIKLLSKIERDDLAEFLEKNTYGRAEESTFAACSRGVMNSGLSGSHSAVRGQLNSGVKRASCRDVKNYRSKKSRK